MTLIRKHFSLGYPLDFGVTLSGGIFIWKGDDMETKERQHQWYLDNRERILEQHKQYASTHKQQKKKREHRRYIMDKDILTENNKKWRLANKERFAEMNANGHLRRKYGITLEQYKEMVMKQDSKCSICNQCVDKLTVDHDHSNGKVRGLLCNACNVGLGNFRDNTSYLRKAIDYLVKSFTTFSVS